MTTTETKSKTALPRIPWWLGATLFAAIAVFFLREEHRAHILGALPWLLLLACPLIHLFMHGGHGGHGHGSDSSSDRQRNDHSHHPRRCAVNHGGQGIPAYGLWTLVIINSAIFIIFAFSFFKPKTKRDWRTFGSFSAFIVALFVEMYGFPLTIYLLSGWLAVGFLLQWPTLITLIMFPILVAVYVRLAHREEREVAAEFGDAWTRYASVTPRWFPRVGGSSRPLEGEGSAHG